MKNTLLMFVLLPLMALADTWTDPNTGVEWAYTVNGGKAELFNGYDPVIPPSMIGPVVIPSNLGGYPVTVIGKYAFYNCRGLTSVVIPSSVTSIGPCAFQYCDGVASVTIPSNVTSIGGDAFEGCSALQIVFVTDAPQDCVKQCFGDQMLYQKIGSSINYEWEWECRNGKVVINGVRPAVGDIVIPESFDGQPVTSIGGGAFRGCTGLTSVTIPRGVTGIRDDAFSGCCGLTSVMIPSSVTSIGSGAFRNCCRLTSVTIPEGVRSIANGTFYNCSGLTEVMIPSSVCSIGNWAFSGCSSLASVVIPSSVEDIGDYAFSGCSSIATLDISVGVKSIGEWAFDSCSSLAFVALPSSVSSVGWGTFEDCASLHTVMLASGISGIAGNMFCRCENLTVITIPRSVNVIGDQAFYKCSALSTIYINPDSIDRVKEMLESTTQKDLCVDVSNVTFVEANWDSECRGEEVWHYVVPKEGRAEILGVNAFRCLSGKVQIPAVLGVDRVSAIGPYVFKDRSDIVSLSLPQCLETISDSAFLGCNSISSLVLPGCVSSVMSTFPDAYAQIKEVEICDGVTSVGKMVFEHCIGIESLKIPASVISVSSKSFKDCISLEKVTLPACIADYPGCLEKYFPSVFMSLREVVVCEGATSIGYQAFQHCKMLSSVSIPSSIEKICVSAFDDCISLKSVEIQDLAAWCAIDFDDSKSNPLYFAHMLKLNGYGVSDLVIPDTVSTIGKYAFDGCSGLASVTIPSSVTYIGDYAFSACSGLKRVYVSSVADWVGVRFGNAGANPLWNGATLYVDGKGVTELVIPEGTTEIGAYAFYGGSFTSVTIPSSVTYIGDYAFARCSSLKSIVVPWGLDLGKAQVPATAKIIRSIPVVASGRNDEYVYDGVGKRFGAELRSSADGYDVNDVTNTLPVSGAAVGTYRQNLSAEMFFNKNSNFEVAFAVDSNKGVSTVKILPRSVEVIAGSKSKTYDGTPLSYDFAEIKVGGFVGNDCKVSAVGSRTSVGTSKNTAVLKWAQDALKANYSVVTKEGTLTVLPAKVANTGEEPGAGTKPAGGISKFDGEAVKYDGEGHTINVAALEAVTLVADTPVFSYSLTSNGVYRSEPYYFTNACVMSFWYKISAANYEDYVHEARVTILPREVTLTSGSASKNFDGTALRCERVEVTGDGFVTGDGVDVVYTGSQLWPGASENAFTYSFRQGTMESNYDVTTANGILTVGAAGRVVVDTSVTAIPAKAFKNYVELTEVVLPDTVTEIGADAFAGCTRLTKVAFPSGLVMTREKLQEWGLSDAVLDDYVEGDFIIVNKSLLGYVGAADVAELVIPDGIELIDEYALAELDDLERVELPETVKYIGKGAFANDTYLDEVVLPDSVELIGEGAFENCSWMQTMTMGAGVRSVGDRAFAGCTKLAAAKFAEGLGEVGDAAFSNCWRMMSVSLPVSVSNVAATAFKDCASLTGVTVPTMIAPMLEWFAPVYRQVENVTVPEGTTEVCAEMFAGCAALKTVELPEGVTNIASGAFRDCVALETILLPESVEAIGDEAFAGCAALKAIVLPKNVAVLGKRVFSGCAALSDVTLSRALTAIPDGTFAGCDALDSFVVPEAVAELGSQIVPSATTAIYYLGNAPAYAADVYAGANAALVSYVVDGTKGWDGRPTSRDLPRDWPTSNARTIRTWSPPPPSITVRFNATGGTVEPEERIYVSETPFGELPVPVRTHYDFAGWFTEASGGAQVTAESEVPMADRELFAHWTERVEPPVEPPVEPVIEPVVTNTITYINLLGATNTNVTEFTTNDLPLALGPVECEGWRFLGWAPNGGVIPVGTATNVTFTANWEKVIEPLPVEPPEESEVNPWCEDADFSAAVANSYDGYVIDEDYNLLGVVQVKTTKQVVKKTTDKKTKKVTSVTTNITATATVTDANGKKWSYSKGEVTVEGVVTGLKCMTKGCPVAEFGVKVGMNGMDGAWGEYAIFGARNGMGTKGDAMMTALEAYKGKWSVSLSTSGEDAASPQVVRLQLDVQAKGVVKVAGNWESGAKVSASAQLVMGDGFAYVPVMVKSTKTSPALNALLRIDGADGDVHAVRTITLLSEGELVGGGRTTAAIEIVGYLAENPVKAGAAYVGRVALNELAYPAKFTQKGLPTGLKIDSATGVVSGTPTKPGEYEVSFTATSSMNSKSNDAVKVAIKVENYVDGLIPVEDYYGPYTPGVSYTVTISAADGCTVSGLPTGMKWTAKDVKAKDGTVTTPANSIYGIPTKPGKYTVYFKKSVSELNEKNKSVKVTHTATATFEVADYPTITLLPSLAIAGSEPMAVTEGAALSFFVGVKQAFAINLAGTLDGVDTTVSAKGLPSGLKLVKKTVYVDPSAKKKVVDHYEYVIEGVPTKASSLDKQKNVVPSHVTLTASNKYKWSGTFAFDITVVALPTWAYGTFDGGNTNGMAQLTVSNVGKLSGKWMSEGLTWTLSAASFDAYDAEREAYCAMVIGKSGKLVMTNEIEVTESGVESELFEAWRNGWKEESLKTLAKDLKGKKVSVAAPVAEDRDGTVELTVGASGAVTAKGTFGSYSASCSTVLIPTAEAGRYRVYLYFPPKAGKFEGFADIVEIGFSDS